jgi:porin
LGAGAKTPSRSFLDSQYTGEIFYRFNVTPHGAITPGLEHCAHPALNPGVDRRWVLSLRGRIVF